jgi:hypothetical protein
VQVTAHNLSKRTDRATVSNTDGVFTFTNLEPGPYEFASSGLSVGDSRGIMAGIADHPREFVPPFPAPQADAHCVE